jgi:hypothetical protein
MAFLFSVMCSGKPPSAKALKVLVFNKSYPCLGLEKHVLVTSVMTISQSFPLDQPMPMA